MRICLLLFEARSDVAQAGLELLIFSSRVVALWVNTVMCGLLIHQEDIPRCARQLKFRSAIHCLALPAR